MRRRFLRLFFVSFAAAFSFKDASYANVLLDWQGNDAGLIIDGPITEETTFEVGWAEFEVRHEGGNVVAVILNSPGGLVAQASVLAKDIYDKNVQVFVLKGSVCASACFLLLAAARLKYISPSAEVGIHSAITIGVGEDEMALAITSALAREVASYGIPDSIIGKLVRTPPSELSILNREEIKTIPGAVVVESIPLSDKLASAKPIHEYLAGYGTGGMIAAGKLSYSGCLFSNYEFQRGCLRGIADAPSEGWANFLPSLRNTR